MAAQGCARFGCGGGEAKGTAGGALHSGGGEGAAPQHPPSGCATKVRAKACTNHFTGSAYRGMVHLRVRSTERCCRWRAAHLQACTRILSITITSLLRRNRGPLNPLIRTPVLHLLNGEHMAERCPSSSHSPRLLDAPAVSFLAPSTGKRGTWASSSITL